jgi:glycosyltransferase involved in cell wall biosynthesis
MEFPNDPLRHYLLRSILLSADAITATSHFLRRATAGMAKKLADRVEVIPFGVSIPPTVVTPPAEPPLRLCYIKAHRRIYGPDILIKALAQVRERGHDVNLFLAGEGEMTGELRQLCRKLGVDDAVTFVGFIDNANIVDFISDHHVMVMPSHQESFGVAVLEAGAAGRPVIATDIGGVPEVLRPEKTGLMVPPNDVGALADAIARLAEQPQLRAELGRNAREFAQSEYSWDRSLDLMIDLYERLIREKDQA